MIDSGPNFVNSIIVVNAHIIIEMQILVNFFKSISAHGLAN